MSFPEKEDRELIRLANEVERFADGLWEWLGKFNPSRRQRGGCAIDESEEFEVFQLRKKARNLSSSARVPVAAAVYGPSQVGKSLFVGQVLRARDSKGSPLGRDDAAGPPAYYPQLSFERDLNPHVGANEATSVVTRFTTPDRFPEKVPPQYPAMVRMLTRGEWLRVLARGFQIECRAPETPWDDDRLEELFQTVARAHPAPEVDRAWRLDLLETYSYLRRVDPRGFPAKEAMVNALITRFPLSEQGYGVAASRLFWGGWESLSELFGKVDGFLRRIASPNSPPAMFVPWVGVRFLLDTQRSRQLPATPCFAEGCWTDFGLRNRNGSWVLECQPNHAGSAEELDILQAAMLEMVLPVLPHLLCDEWAEVLRQMDLLDIPGMRAGRLGPEQGKRTAADTIQEQMEIVKRGKVAYLFERYTEELQIQTLVLLFRGGNLEVSGQMKYHVDLWGRAHYGEDRWPQRVRDTRPALLIGLTGIDEEFRNSQQYADTRLYERRLAQLVDTLGSIMTDFGGPGQPFRQVFPVRYPGTWDTTASQRDREGAEKWERARAAFLASKSVARYVECPEEVWDAALGEDGGLRRASKLIRQTTDSSKKRRQLRDQVAELRSRLCQLSNAWLVDPGTHAEREKRWRVGQRVLEWLRSDPRAVHLRVNALRRCLCLAQGDEIPVAAVNIHGLQDDVLHRTLRQLFNEWAAGWVPKRWTEEGAARRDGAPWLEAGEVSTLAGYLRDYLLSEEVLAALVERLRPFAGLRTGDAAEGRWARRKYVLLILNDFVINPGPGTDPLPDSGNAPPEIQDFTSFGLMAPFMERWHRRLPAALAAGAGQHVEVPPGNEELARLLEAFPGQP